MIGRTSRLGGHTFTLSCLHVLHTYPNTVIFKLSHFPFLSRSPVYFHDPASILALSHFYFHILTFRISLSNFNTFTLSLSHLFTLSKFNTFTLSYYHTLRLSYYHTLTLSNHQTFTLSQFYSVILGGTGQYWLVLVSSLFYWVIIGW